MIILVGLCSLTTLMDIQLLSPYHPTLALNGGGFPEGFACHHLNPFRYIVRRASHPVISATVARLRRVRQEHAGYYYHYLKYTQLNCATSCRTSGRLGTLRSLSPLRTVRESFPSYGSSISKGWLCEPARLCSLLCSHCPIFPGRHGWEQLTLLIMPSLPKV